MEAPSADEILERIEKIQARAPPPPRADAYQLLEQPVHHYTPQIAALWQDLLASYNRVASPKIDPPSGRMAIPAEVDVLEFLASPRVLFMQAAERPWSKEILARVRMHLHRASPGFIDVPPPGLETEFVMANLIANDEFFKSTPPPYAPLHVVDGSVFGLRKSELDERGITGPRRERLEKVSQSIGFMLELAYDVALARGTLEDAAQNTEKRRKRVENILDSLAKYTKGGDDETPQFVFGDDYRLFIAVDIMYECKKIDEEATRLYLALRPAIPDMDGMLLEKNFNYVHTLEGPVFERIAEKYAEAERFAWPPSAVHFPQMYDALVHVIALVNSGLADTSRRVTLEGIVRMPERARTLIVRAAAAELSYRAIEMKREYPASHYRHLATAPIAIAVEAALEMRRG